MAIAKGIGICPAAPLREPVPDAGNGQGTADKAWVRWTSDERTKFFGSYGFISWQYTRAQNQILLSFNGEANIQQPSTKLRKLAAEAKLPGGFNIGFADGHSKLVPLEQLWNLSWYFDWQVPAMRPQNPR